MSEDQNNDQNNGVYGTPPAQSLLGNPSSPLPNIEYLDKISQLDGEEIKEIQRSFPALINNIQQTLGNIPSGQDFKLMTLRQKRLAIYGRARMGRVTIKSMEQQLTAEYISRLELLRGKDAAERTFLTTSRMLTTPEGNTPQQKTGVLGGIRNALGV